MNKPTSLNDVFEQSSFLHGANAAYIEDLYSRFQENPGAVSADWRAFFVGLRERKEDVIAEARGPSWKRQDWPVAVNGELVNALAGDWQEAAERRIEQNIAGKAQTEGVELSPAETLKAVRDFDPRADADPRLSRARPFRRHLDPLGLTERSPIPSWSRRPTASARPISTGSIYIDNVLGLETATMREILEILRRTYCATDRRRVHAHHRARAEGLDPGAHRGRTTRRSASPKGQEGDSRQARSKPRGSKNSSTRNIPAPSASASTAAKSPIPALEQIIKRGGAARRARNRARHGASRPPQRARQRAVQSPIARSSMSSRAARPIRTRSRAPAT